MLFLGILGDPRLGNAQFWDHHTIFTIFLAMILPICESHVIQLIQRMEDCEIMRSYVSDLEFDKN